MTTLNINRVVTQSVNSSVTLSVSAKGDILVNGVPHLRVRSGDHKNSGAFSRLRVPADKRVAGLRYLADGRWAIPAA